MKKFKVNLSDVFLGFALAFLAVAIVMAVYFKNNPREAYIFGYRPYIVQTGSMEPKLMTNSLIVVKKGEFNKIAEGDIIHYVLNDEPVGICHRAVEKTDEGWATKGDNNNVKDKYLVTEKEYVGKVVFSTNWTADFYKGVLNKETRSWAGIWHYVLLPLGLVVLAVGLVFLAKWLWGGEKKVGGK